MPGAVISWVCREKQVLLHQVLTVFTGTAKTSCDSGLVSLKYSINIQQQKASVKSNIGGQAFRRLCSFLRFCG